MNFYDIVLMFFWFTIFCLLTGGAVGLIMALLISVFYLVQIKGDFK